MGIFLACFAFHKASVINSSTALSVSPSVSEICVAQQKNLDVIYK